MLSLHSWRTMFSSRALLHPNWLMTNRQSSNIAVKRLAQCVSFKYGSSPQKGTWHSNMTLKNLGKENKLIYSTNASLVNSSRGYCTGQVKLNCWNCKQPIDKTPAFFCMSCNVVQPPEEGTSYFKIMDWYVSYPLPLITFHLQGHSMNFKAFHVNLCLLFLVTIHSDWIHRSCREDLCSSRGLYIQTTSARNLRYSGGYK